MPSTGNILVVDDDSRIRRVVSRYLTNEGYRVAEASSAEEMRQRLPLVAPDLVILDLMLPDEDGLTLARELRARSPVAIIMLTGKRDVVDRVVGLEVGADDYVTKPFEERELLARVRSVLRRTRNEPVDASGKHTLSFAGWRLDLAAHELYAPSGERVDLTTHQFQILAALAAHPNRVLSRGELLELVANRDWSPMDRSIDVLIGKLRKRIEPDPRQPRFIKTIRGVGYKFATEVLRDRG